MWTGVERGGRHDVKLAGVTMVRKHIDQLNNYQYLPEKVSASWG
jgi:hypothetical protein